MKKSSSELKSIAKGSLLERYSLPVGSFLLLMLIVTVISFIRNTIFSIPDDGDLLSTFILTLVIFLLASLIVSFLMGILRTGWVWLVMKLSRNQEATLSDLFYCFSHHPDKIVILTLLMLLIEIGCLLPGYILLIVAILQMNLIYIFAALFALIAGPIVAIIFIFSYSQVYFIYLDAPEKGSIQIMRESREMMNGNKGRLFYLGISFIGLMLLSILTCGIGLLWLAPYMQMTEIQFYRNLIGEI